MDRGESNIGSRGLKKVTARLIVYIRSADRPILGIRAWLEVPSILRALKTLMLELECIGKA
jgi:hypothetical protein